MCGILGFINKTNDANINSEKLLNDMCTSLFHRGPDSSDFLQIDNIHIGHTRLAILDLSSAGSQPIFSKCKRFCMSFNGEIYNFQDLKATLESRGAIFNGTSDTEVLIESFSYFGIEKTLDLIDGMYAISLIDFTKDELILIRDPAGEKPLYFSNTSKLFIFGSDLRVFNHHPYFYREIDRDSLYLFTKFNYIPSPKTIYKNVEKLEPGTLLKYSFKKDSHYRFKFFNLSQPVHNTNYQISDTKELIIKSVKDRMQSDVPLGCLLSGGIDSSLICSIMQSQSKDPINTFTIGFKNKHYNEASHAKLVAEHLGTKHHELILKPSDLLSIIPDIGNIFTEPFADPSLIPTYFVSKLARTEVPVALSGDGGDELFGGYNRYFMYQNLEFFLKFSPKNKKILKKLIQIIGLSNLLRLLSNFGFRNLYHVAQKLDKFSDRLTNINSQNDIYKSFVTEWNECDAVNLVSQNLNEFTKIDFVKNDSFERRMMDSDFLSYLPDDILTKVDRCSMAHSLEVRAPFLSKELIDHSRGIPFNQLFAKNRGKLVLKKILNEFVPNQITDRSKVGFQMPIDIWLRGELKDWASDLINDIDNDLFDKESINSVFNDHINGKFNHGFKLWSILMYQQWAMQSL